LLDWEIPPLVYYPPIEDHRTRRTGSEEEYAMHGRLGNQNVVDDKNSEVAPKTFTFKLDIPTFSSVTTHSSLRSYANPAPVTEMDPEYYLQS
jgi:hypothetical protein